MKDAEEQLKDDIKELKSKLKKDGMDVKSKSHEPMDFKKVALYAMPFLILIVAIGGFIAGTKFMQTVDEPVQTNAPVEDTTEPQDTIQEPIEDTPEEQIVDDEPTEVVLDEHGCYDSDGGSFPDDKGYVIDTQGNRFDDYCQGQLVFEMLCNQVGYKKEKLFDCEFGCENGTCKEGDPTAGESECYDSDGGSFPDTKGYVVDKNDNRYDDTCIGLNVLEEYRCGPYDYKATSIISCDYQCQDGACVDGVAQDEPKCFDSDGANEFSKGYIEDIKGDQYWDACLNVDTVTEMRCNPFGYKNEVYIGCANGCDNGACNN